MERSNTLCGMSGRGFPSTSLTLRLCSGSPSGVEGRDGEQSRTVPLPLGGTKRRPCIQTGRDMVSGFLAGLTPNPTAKISRKILLDKLRRYHYILGVKRGSPQVVAERADFKRFPKGDKHMAAKKKAKKKR